MHPNTTLYEQDLYTWCLATADLIRAGKWHDIDLDALAEEIESLGKSQKRELEHRLEVLVMHLLKWRYQPERRVDSHSWYDTIREQRNRLARLLRDNPGLRPQLALALTEGYAEARLRALGETRLLAGVMPTTCPWTAAQVLDTTFWPEGA